MKTANGVVALLWVALAGVPPVGLAAGIVQSNTELMEMMRQQADPDAELNRKGMVGAPTIIQPMTEREQRRDRRDRSGFSDSGRNSRKQRGVGDNDSLNWQDENRGYRRAQPGYNGYNDARSGRGDGRAERRRAPDYGRDDDLKWQSDWRGERRRPFDEDRYQDNSYWKTNPYPGARRYRGDDDGYQGSSTRTYGGERRYHSPH